VIGLVLAVAVVAIVVSLLGGWIFGIPLALVAVVLFVLYLVGFGRRTARGGP
jgi:hypothetical protein